MSYRLFWGCAGRAACVGDQGARFNASTPGFVAGRHLGTPAITDPERWGRDEQQGLWSQAVNRMVASSTVMGASMRELKLALAAGPSQQFLNTLTVLALVVMSFALIVAVPVLYASSEDSGRSNRLILLGSAVWVALVLLNWGVSFFVV